MPNGAYRPVGRLVAAHPLRRRLCNRARHRNVPLRKRHQRGANRRPGAWRRSRACGADLRCAADQCRPSAAHVDAAPCVTNDEPGARRRVRGFHSRAVPTAGRRRGRTRRRRCRRRVRAADSGARDRPHPRSAGRHVCDLHRMGARRTRIRTRPGATAARGSRHRHLPTGRHRRAAGSTQRRLHHRTLAVRARR